MFRPVLPLVLAVLVAATATAQVPDEFTNLQVFPRDVGKRQLINVMKEFSSALGVECTHCHVMKVPGDFNSIDWASDGLLVKDEARGMMRMVGKLNSELVPQAMGKPVQRVQCVTCHRGLPDPRYYGRGSYDFGPGTLIDVATTLAQGRGDTMGALKMLRLNVEMHPEDVQSYVMMSQIHILGGDKEGAVANAKKALELDPENTQAAGLLEQFGEGADGK